MGFHHIMRRFVKQLQFSPHATYSVDCLHCMKLPFSFRYLSEQKEKIQYFILEHQADKDYKMLQQTVISVVQKSSHVPRL